MKSCERLAKCPSQGLLLWQREIGDGVRQGLAERVLDDDVRSLDGVVGVGVDLDDIGDGDGWGGVLEVVEGGDLASVLALQPLERGGVLVGVEADARGDGDFIFEFEGERLRRGRRDWGREGRSTTGGKRTLVRSLLGSVSRGFTLD